MRRWALPIVLLVVALVAGTLAWRADADADEADQPDLETATPTTPVLSARRMPVWLLRPGGAEALDLALADFIAQSPQPACLIVESGGQRIVDLNATEPVVPASNLKLLVATAALEQLGADRVFTTSAAASTDVGEGGVLEGDLWLLGGGDPLLGTDYYLAGLEQPEQPHTRFEALADQLAERGVTQITGGVIGDDTRYDNLRTIESWPERGLTRSQPGPFSALSVNDGFETYPLDPESDESPEPAEDPPLMAAEVFTDLLAERGIQVDGTPGANVAPDNLLTLASVDSPPMREVVGQMLEISDNTTAELLVKELGLQRLGEGSTEVGTQAVVEILSGLGLPMDGVVMRDGSGLHDENRVTCDLLIALLERAGEDSDLAAGLAVAGQSGTLVERFLDTFVSGRLRAKSGFLDESTALSGFVDTLTGIDVLFAYVANGADLDADDVDLQEQLANALVRYPEGPPIDQLVPLPVVGSAAIDAPTSTSAPATTATATTAGG
jgi:D-alanyl-D-alanine carboxypeptidase/D-alanyl-D-alanine-endopeptidase (penicillin-binding protein 4)